MLLDEECLGADQPHLHFPTLSQVNLAGAAATATAAGAAAAAASVSTDLALPDREVSWGREHSLGEYPLPHASVSQSALDAAFDHRTGAWATPPNYFTITKEASKMAVKPSAVSNVPSHGIIASHTAFVPLKDSSSTPYESTPLDEGFGLESFMSDDTHGSDSSNEVAPLRAHGSQFGELPGAAKAPSPTVPAPPQVSVQVSEGMSEPGFEHYYYSSTADINKDAIKRATSHQNETYETKRHLMGPSVKRMALNRDGTAGRLSMAPDSAVPVAAPFNEDHAMRELTQTMEKSTLLESAPDHAAPSPPTAGSLAGYDRVTTIDRISLDLISHPVSLSRTNTAEIMDTLASASASASDLDEEAFNQFLDNII